VRRLLLLGLALLALPALTPTPVRSVFFDGWHARLDAAALAVLAEIAADPPRGRWYVVEGFTDASVPPPQDRAMGEARAQAVAAELRRLGLPAALIHVRGYGAAGPDGAPHHPPGLVVPAANRVAIWTCYANAPVCRGVTR
jgi:hypothetical protein